MKKSKKFLSVLCAVCMILAMAAPAMAADTDVSTLSENAGTTVDVNVVHFTADGEQNYNIEVAIPENATADMENDLIAVAGNKAAGISTSLTRATMADDKLYLCGKDGEQKINFGAMTEGDASNSLVGSAHMTVRYSQLNLVLSRPSTGVTRIFFRFENSAYGIGSEPDDNVYEKYIVASGATKTYIIADGNTLPSDNENAGAIHLDADTTLTVYCSGAKPIPGTDKFEGVKGSCFMQVYLTK